MDSPLIERKFLAASSTPYQWPCSRNGSVPGSGSEIASLDATKAWIWSLFRGIASSIRCSDTCVTDASSAGYWAESYTNGSVRSLIQSSTSHLDVLLPVHLSEFRA